MRHVQDHLLARTCPEFKAQKIQQSTTDVSKAGGHATVGMQADFMPPPVAKVKCYHATGNGAGAASHVGTITQHTDPASTQQSNGTQ